MSGTITVGDFLTEEQVNECLTLYEATEAHKFARQCSAKVIEPNIDEINLKLGQENDPLFLAYAVLHAIKQVQH